MSKIFDVQDWLKNHPNRNNFDLTHKVHGSYQFGKLYPVLCKPVVPTDSFRIDTAVSLRFTPMPFPTQSNMRVIFHYFYVRNKNIWKNWSNWLQGLEKHTPPYIDKSPSFYKDGSLADHLGIQTSFTSNIEEVTLEKQLSMSGVILDNSTSFVKIPTLPSNLVESPDFVRNSPFLRSYVENYGSTILKPLYILFDICDSSDGRSYPYFTSAPFFDFQDATPSPTAFHDYGFEDKFMFLFVDINGYIRASFISNGTSLLLVSQSPGYVTSDGARYFFKEPLRCIRCNKANPTLDTPTIDNPVGCPFELSNVKCVYYLPPRHLSLGESGVASPYAFTGDSTGKVKVSALPFRAYESIYNAFYRNSQGVQPFQINGVTQYNKYVTNDGDGADTTNYDLFERNWELDAYTSCLISPQQGNVPYVGITDISALGRMHIETPEGDSAEVRLSDNGDGVEISNLRGDTPEARAYALRAASSGFTIPEFREANSLQRFLEMNIRKGYKYIDFIEGHFGKKPTYSEMDMPEFIGGFSQRISVNEISNTNGVDNDTLGAIAGQARAIGGSKHGINHYFDDFGFVVGIMCIVPDNAYDSILPKHFNLKNPLDCYFPEFSQLSYMPLTHEELAPLQTINDPRGSAYRDLTKVFGYQRPNHDLVWYPDTVHGLFRDSSGVGNSVICRRFATRPELSDSFLRIKPEETDTIFNYTFGDEDVALGEIVLSIKAKRPIPRLVVPSIS